MDIQYVLKTFQELNLEELYQILQIRQKVFIVEQNCPYLDCDNKDLKAYHLLGINQHGELSSYSRLLPPGVSYPDDASIGRVLSDERLRGTGAGKSLMLESIKYCQLKFGNLPIRISAQCYLMGFYRSFGFTEVGEEYLEDDIPHIEMVLIPRNIVVPTP